MRFDASRIEEIRTRAEMATEAPWNVLWGDEEREYATGFHVAVHGIESIVPRHCHDPDIVETDSGVYPPLPEDAKFIAHAREDIPYLLEVIDELEQHLDENSRGLE